MSRFTDYAEAVRRGLTLRWKIELTDRSGVVLATTERLEEGSTAIRWGAELRPVSFASDRVSTSNASMAVPVTDPALVPSLAGSMLHPDTGNIVQLWAGFDLAAGPTYWKVGSLVASDVEGVWNEGVAALSIVLVDRARPLQSEVETSIPFSDGRSVESMVQVLFEQVLSGVTPFSVSATGYTLPDGSIEPGTTRAEAINKMLEGCGHELVVDVEGRVSNRPIPQTVVAASAERWVYGEGEGAIPIQNVNRGWSSKTPQAWRVEGGSLQNEDEPIIVTVYDTDPTSQGYYDGQKPAQVRTSRFPWIRTKAQGAAAGYGQLRRNGIGKMVVSFETVPNPSMREGDPIELSVPSLNIDGLFQVFEMSLPVMADGTMSVIARHVWDARANYHEGAEDGSALDYLFDDFNRPNQNLEDTNEGGSINWTEFGYSWAVAGEKAIQRYNGVWSFARNNNPLTSSEHEASVKVYPTAGHEVGPMVRSNGTFEGYAAVADLNGRIRITSWQGGHQTATLATYETGAGITGKTVQLKADGSILSLYVDGAYKGQTNLADTPNVGEHHGTSAGMIAFGGHGSQAPAADDFTASVV